VNLILAYVVWPQLFGRPAEILGELLDRMDVGSYGVRRVVATLGLIQHHLAKMGHREPSL
jgi:hypothetical protein